MDVTDTHRGSSVAKIVSTDLITVKLDSAETRTFVKRQGEWLLEWSPKSKLLPAVYEVTPRSYTMETLLIPDLTGLQVDHYCEIILNRLQRDLWPLADAPWGTDFEDFQIAHTPYVRDLCNDVNSLYLRVQMPVWARLIQWRELRGGLTHGDPIIDNVAFRRYVGDPEELVLIDPIPATPALPNWCAVDVGRVIQSAIGYESVRYGFKDEDASKSLSGSVNFVLNRYMPKKLDYNEVRTSIYFAIIHMMRGVRTAPTPEIKRDLWVLIKKLISEMILWMR